jgi:NADPH:quinone reductase-like Zn-dependent oxidoreductase
VNREKGGLIGEMWPGGLAEYCAVPAQQLVSMPPDVSAVSAAALPVAYGTAHRMLTTRGKIRSGERVLILGASGGVGTGCVQLAKMLGAEVVACASTPEKLRRLKDLGADHVIDYRANDFVKVIYEKFGKPRRRSTTSGVDVVVNFTGGETWVQSLKCLRHGGRMLTCGATAGFDPRTDIRYIWTFELDILGSNGWLREDISALLGYVQEGKLTPVVDRVFPLAEASEAFRLIENREVFGKVIVAPQQ